MHSGTGLCASDATRPQPPDESRSLKAILPLLRFHLQLSYTFDFFFPKSTNHPGTVKIYDFFLLIYRVFFQAAPKTRREKKKKNYQAFLHAENISDLIIKRSSTIQTPRTLKPITRNEIRIKSTSSCKNSNKVKANKTLLSVLGCDWIQDQKNTTEPPSPGSLCL